MIRRAEHLRMEAHEQLAAALRAVDESLPAPDRIRAMGRVYHAFGRSHPRLYALMFGTERGAPPRREAVQREMFTLMLLRDAVRRGMARHELRADLDDMVVTNVLWAEIHGVTALAVAGLLPETAPGQQEAVLDGVVASAIGWLAPR